MKVHIAITLDRNLLKKIDSKRGQIKRSTFINDKLGEAI